MKSTDLSSGLTAITLHLSAWKGRVVSLFQPLFDENRWTELVTDKISKMDEMAGGEE